MPPECPVLITPKAQAQLRGLPLDVQDRAERLIRRLRDTPHAVSQKLAGGSGAWRSRLKTSRVRIAWAPEPNSGPVVFYVGLRDERTYSDLFRIVGADHGAAASPYPFEDDDDELVEARGAGTAHLPAYVLPATWDVASWQALVFGDGVLSPRLTADQASDFQSLLWQSGQAGDRCAVVQGGAGSGKSVCALLWSASLRSGASGLDRHHVSYLAPAGLARRLRTFDEAKHYLAPPEDHILTPQAWFVSLLPRDLRRSHVRPAGEAEHAPGLDADAREDAVLAEVEALRAEALQAALRRATFTGKARRPPNVMRGDVLLYEALVLGRGARKDGAAGEHETRARALAAADPAVWAKELAARGVSSRTQLALDVQVHGRARPAGLGGDEAPIPALIVVDEAQDLLVEELRAVCAVWKRWNDAGHETRLWLFGDLNQRITPSGFTWDSLAREVGLESGRRTMDTNYRNTAAVLALAAGVLRHGQASARSGKNRHLPEPPTTTATTADAEPVRAVRVGDAEGARRFVAAMKPDGRSPYFRASQARKAQILSPTPLSGLEHATVNEPTAIKGSELEAAITVGLFEPLARSPDSVQETNICYTLVTRVRSRLLLALTDAEHAWATAAGLLGGVEVAGHAEAARWVAELASAADLRSDPEGTFEALLRPSPNGGPWFDAWDVLSESGQADRAGEWAERASERWTPDGLRAAAESPSPWVRTVALAALGRYPDAERAAAEFRATLAAQLGADAGSVQTNEAHRLVEGLARRYESAGRPYEAHRLRARTRPDYPAPEGLPFPDMDPHAPLGDALLLAVANRLRAINAQTDHA